MTTFLRVVSYQASHKSDKFTPTSNRFKLFKARLNIRLNIRETCKLRHDNNRKVAMVITKKPTRIISIVKNSHDCEEKM